MAITSSISRNTVTNLVTNFKIDLNIQAQTNYNVTEYELFQDGVSQGNTTISPTTNEFSTIETFYEANTGFHSYEVLFRNTNAEEDSSSLTLYLDNVVPVVNNFSVASVSKNSSNDYEITFDIQLYDETGISKFDVTESGITTTVTTNITTSSYNTTHTRTVNGSFIGTKNYTLTAYDYSGNYVTTANLPVVLNNVPPVIGSADIVQITQTASEYIIDVQLQGVTLTGQNIAEYSVYYNSNIKDWQSYVVASGAFTINHTLNVPKTEPAGLKQIYTYVKDNYGNESIPAVISFNLDKIAPMGSVDVDKIEKIASNYFVDLELNATDAGDVAAYAYAFDDPNPSTWNLITPTSIFNLIVPNINIGPSGQTTAFVKYRDFSGNESSVYFKNIEIDTTIPDAQFGFSRAEKRTDGDYNIFFDVLASDNKNVTSIKFYGENSNTTNVVSGHNSNWQNIVPTPSINEEKVLVLPASESEDSIRFYWQARDVFSNESPVRTLDFTFDKTDPVITSFTYEDAEQIGGNFRIYGRLQATDNVEITEYKIAYDDLSSATWKSFSANSIIDETIYLDFPSADVGTSKLFLAQVKDRFGNISANASFSVNPESDAPTGNAVFAAGGLTATDFIVYVDLNATDPSSNVYWYSIVADDPTTRDWKPLTTPNTTISEVQSVLVPKTNGGLHDFYVHYADEWKNESPAYHFQYDLDSTGIVGGIDLERVTYDGTNYTANLHLYAFDNKTVRKYILNGANNTISPAVQTFDFYRPEVLGNTAGPRTFTVQYEDGFGNLSDPYTLNLNLEKNAPVTNIQYKSTTRDSSFYYMNCDLVSTDVTELRDYKFWYDGNPEPSSWSTFPIGKTTYTVNQTFNVPIVDVTPTFRAKVRDIFDNETSTILNKTITTGPPTVSSLTQNNISFSSSGTTVTLDYSAYAAAGSLVNKLKVYVQNYPPSTPLDYFEVSANNTSPVSGSFQYTYPTSYTSGRFYVSPVSDYGYERLPSVVLNTNFDNLAPVISNVTHEGSFNSGSDLIVQLRVQATDASSGIKLVRIIATSYTPNRIFDYPVTLTNNLDQVFNITIDSSHTGAFANFVVYTYDLLNNLSTGYTISGVYVDRLAPTISNIEFNNGTTFSSVIEGSNTAIVPFSFDSSDLSEITHYKISQSNVEPYNSTWTSVGTPVSSISVATTLNLNSLGYSNGLNTLFVHVIDKYNNIATAGKQFEFDNTPPTISTSFLGTVERVNVGIVEFFKIPYTLTFADTYSGVVDKYAWYEEGANTGPLSYTAFPSTNSYSNTTHQLILVGNYGDVTFKERVTDRFGNQSANAEFNVFLENNPPNIIDFRINNNAVYTQVKDVFVRINATDDVAITNVYFSSSNTIQWDTPGWLSIPFGPNPAINFTYGVDLTTIGFSPGVCNVYSYAKDFCQNVANTVKTIIFDPDPPVANSFYVNSITRTANTFDIELLADAYDTISGLNEYIITQSPIDTNFVAVPAAPVVNSVTSFSQTEQISVIDSGMKTFYFQVKDAAGNLSTKANTSIYIDSVTPIVSFFEPTSTFSKYYLNANTNQFSYIVSDNYALKDIEYQVDSNTIHTLNSFDPALNVINHSNTFNADFGGLADGVHKIYLMVEDGFQNQLRVPYEFFYDGTAPTINHFNINEIKPKSTPNHYSVELNVSATDNVLITKYELYVDSVLVATVPVNLITFAATPTINVILGAALATKTFELRVYDLSGNMSSQSFTKDMHNGSNVQVSNFLVAGANSYSTAIPTTVAFTGDVSSDVNITDYAITANNSLDFYSAFWTNVASPNTSISISENISLNDLALVSGTATDVYLHVKDDCGNQASNTVPVTLTTTQPQVTNLTSPVTLNRQGSYYVGDLSFTISDDTTIVAYALGTSNNPTNFKSILPTSSGTITQQFKIPVSQINGSALMYLRLKDDTGDISPNYRFSIRVIDFEIEKFEIDLDTHITGSATVDVTYDTANNPLQLEYGYKIDDTTKPTSWTAVSGVTQNSVGEYNFNFNLNVSAISAGKHALYVWLKSPSGETEWKEVEFISEQTAVVPTVALSILKYEVSQGKKKVWVEGLFSDAGVGVKEYSIEESTNPHSYNTINITQTKKIVKLFEYATTNNNIITYKARAKDASGATTPTDTTTSIDLTNVF